MLTPMKFIKAAQYHDATNTRIYLEDDDATNTKTPQMTRPDSLLNRCIHELPKRKRKQYRDDTNDTPHLILSRYSTSSAQKQTSAPSCYKAWGSVGTRESADLSPGNIYCIKQTTDDDLSMKHSLKSSTPSRKIRQRHTCNQFLFSTPTRHPSAGISSGRNLVEHGFFSRYLRRTNNEHRQYTCNWLGQAQPPDARVLSTMMVSCDDHTLRVNNDKPIRNGV